MVLPLVSALQNGNHFLAGALMLTTIASTLRWRHLARTRKVDAVYHNLDHLGLVLVLAQVHAGFWPLLAPLFAVTRIALAFLLLRVLSLHRYFGPAVPRINTLLPFRSLAASVFTSGFMPSTSSWYCGVISSVPHLIWFQSYKAVLNIYSLTHP